MPTRRLALLLALAALAPPALAAGPVEIASTAILVQPFHEAHAVLGDDGKNHVEYDLLVTNAFTSPVTLTAVEVTDPAGSVLMRLGGDGLAAATQTLVEGKSVKAIPPSNSVALEIDLILPPGSAPPRLSHRIAYDLPANDPLASIIGSREVVGPEVVVDPRPAIAIRSPLSGPGWGALNGCCVPNIHRNVRLAAGTRMATPEAFAIDWIRIDGGKFFTGDGKANEQYPYFGAAVTAVGDGEVVALHDGMPESIPFQPPTTVHAPADYGGNYVLQRIAPDVYAFYAHLQPGSLAVKVGDRVAAGALLGKLGNSGNSTNPHLHFGLVDRPDFLAGNGLPFVIGSYDLTGTVTGGDLSGLVVTPVSRAIQSAYPLVYGIADFH